MYNNTDKVCHRHLYTKCKGKNCKLKHYTPQVLIDKLNYNNCILWKSFEKLKIPGSNTIINGDNKTVKLYPKNDMKTKEFLQFLLDNNVISKYHKV